MDSDRAASTVASQPVWPWAVATRSTGCPAVPAGRLAASHWIAKAAAVAPTVASAFLITAVNMVQAILLAHALGPVGRGELAASLSYTRLLTYIGLCGVNYVIVRRVAQARVSDSAISRAAVWTGGMTGLATMCVVVVLSLVGLPPEKRYLAWLSILCAATLPLDHMRLNLNAVDQGRGHMTRFNAGRIVAAAVWPALLAVAWCMGGISVARAVVLLVPAALLGLAFRLVWSDDRSYWRTGSPRVRELLREGRPFALSMVVNEIFNNLDWLLMLWLVNFAQQGLYAAALPAVRMLCVAPEALAVFAFNAGAKHDRSPRVGHLVALAAGTLAVQAVAALLYWTVLGSLILLVYKQPFAGATVFAVALLPAMVFQGSAIIADGYMRGRGKANVGIAARLAGAICMALAALLLYRACGAMAVPWAASIGNGVATLWLAAAMIRDARDPQGPVVAPAEMIQTNELPD